MGILRAGILSNITGKVAGVVGGVWKDKNYLRAYVIPANPNSAGQQTQRALFAGCVAFAKLILGQILNVFVDPFQKSMSGFNYFMKQNITEFVASPTWTNIKLTFGKLFIPTINDSTHVIATVTTNFSTATGSNGAATDSVSACVYKTSTGEMFFSAAAVDRSTGTIDVVTGPSLGVAYVYLWAAQYDGTKLVMVSDSNALLVTV